MAAQQKDFMLSGFTAENDLSTKQFYLVEAGGSARTVDVCDSATDTVIGVLCNEPTAGQAAEVQVYGVAKVIYGGTISFGDRVGTTNAGKAVAKTADADKVCGLAMIAGVDGDIGEILLTPGAQRAA